jgi:diguanylate cyclase (GGDEF)-like protein
VKKWKRLSEVVLIVLGCFLLFCSFFSIVKENQSYDLMNQDIARDIHDDTGEKVLLLCSGAAGDLDVQFEQNAIQDTLYRQGIGYDAVYLHDVSDALLQQELQEKIDHGMQGVIACGDAAFTLACREQSSLFASLPVFFMDVTDQDLARTQVQANPLFAGVCDSKRLENAISAFVHILPDAGYLTVVTDGSAQGLTDQKDLQEAMAAHPDLKVHLLQADQMTRDDLQQQIAACDDSTILVYLEAGRDQYGNTYSISDNAEMFAQYASVPVFGIHPGGIGSGIAGTISVNFTKEAQKTASLAASVLLNKTTVQSIGLQTDSSSFSVFDADLLSEYSIARKDLPDNAFIDQDGKASFALHSTVKMQMASAITGVLLLAAGLLINARSYRRIAIAASEEHQQLQYLAQHDALTGLYNRETTFARLLPWLHGASTYTMITLDLDDLKEINDTYSHPCGDVVVAAVGRRLHSFARENDGFVSRYGGDEFLFVKRNVNVTPDDPLVSDMMALVSAQIMADHQPLSVSVSVGIRNCTGSYQDPQRLVLDADLAMYEAKRKGKNCAVLYTAEMRKKLQESHDARQAVVDAIHCDGFKMVYQPQVSTVTQQLAGYEALVRLKNARFGPDVFIPAAEKAGLICEVGRIITEKVIAQMALWQCEGRKLYPVSINYSPGQISDTGYVKWLQEMLEKYHIPPHLLKIEITESMFMNNTQESVRLFDELHRIRVGLLMDDFGTGYSSLSYLSWIPFNTIKIDRSVVTEWLKPGAQDAMNDLISMAHHLGRSLIAEGVETKEQYEILKKQGCDYIQGFYFSRPISAEEAIAWRIGES